jgi:hypothetical protein
LRLTKQLDKLGAGKESHVVHDKLLFRVGSAGPVQPHVARRVVQQLGVRFFDDVSRG